SSTTRITQARITPSRRTTWIRTVRNRSRPGRTPNVRRSVTSQEMSVDDGPTRRPQAAQNLAPEGRAAWQAGQLLGAADISPRSPRIERFQSIARRPPELADHGAVVLVGHLPGPVVELELFQGRECTVSLLLEREPLRGRLDRGLLCAAAEERPGD